MAGVFTRGACESGPEFERPRQLRDDVVRCLEATPHVLLESVFQLRRWLVAYGGERSAGPMAVLNEVLPLAAARPPPGEEGAGPPPLSSPLPWEEFVGMEDVETASLPTVLGFPEALVWRDAAALDEFVLRPHPQSPVLAPLRNRLRLLRLHSPQFEGSGRGVLNAVCGFYQAFLSRLLEADPPARRAMLATGDAPRTTVAIEGRGYFHVPARIVAQLAAPGQQQGFAQQGLSVQAWEHCAPATTGLDGAPTSTSVNPAANSAAWWLQARMLGVAFSMPSLIFVLVSGQSRRVFLAQRSVPGRPLAEVLDAGQQDQVDRKGLSMALFTSVLLNLNEPPESMVVEESGGRPHLLNVSGICSDPIGVADRGRHELRIRNPLWFCPQFWDSQLDASVCRAIQTAAPACVLLRWLGDVRNQEREYGRMALEGALPMEAHAGLCHHLSFPAGVVIRLHRTWTLAQRALAEPASATARLTWGALLAALQPLHAAHVGHVLATLPPTAPLRERVAAQLVLEGVVEADPFARHPSILRKEDVLEHPVHVPGNVEHRATSEDCATELLLAVCLDTTDRPLRPYADAQVLELTEHLTRCFPVIERGSLPSYWDDPELLHAVLRAGGGGRYTAGPLILWFFKDFVSSKGADGLTPLLRVITTTDGSEPFAQRQISSLLSLGADVDGCDRKGLTPVDVCATRNPAMVRQLVQAGAHGGRKTVILMKLYNRLRRSGDDPQLLASLQALARRNPVLRWVLALEEVLPPLPGASARRVQAMTLSDRRFTPLAAGQLFDGAALRACGTRGGRPIGRVEVNGCPVHFRPWPALPGLGAATAEFSRRLFGDWMAPFSELVKFDGALPVEASLPVDGIGLQRVLADLPDRLDRLDRCALSQALINAMLTNPAEASAHDYALEEVDGLYRIVRLDNEPSFVVEEPGERRATLLGGGGGGPRPARALSVLFCLDQMLWSVDTQARAQLLDLDVAGFLHRWLAKAHFINTQHRALFSEAEVRAYAAHDPPTLCGVPIHPRTVRYLTDKLLRLKWLLAHNPRVTHLELLLFLDPPVGKRCLQAFAAAGRALPVLERYELAAAAAAAEGPSPLHRRRDAPRRPGDPVPPAALLTFGPSGDLVKTVLVALAGEACSPSQALDDFAGIRAAADLKKTLGAGALRHHVAAQPEWFEGLAPAGLQEAIARAIKMSSLGIATQTRLVRAVLPRDVRSLQLPFCAAIRDQDLTSRLNAKHLQYLDLSACPLLKLSQRTLAALAERAPLLFELDLSATQLKAFKVPKARFPFLTRLLLNNCPQLRAVEFVGPQLRLLSVEGCAVLSSLRVTAPGLHTVNMRDCPGLEPTATPAPPADADDTADDAESLADEPPADHGEEAAASSHPGAKWWIENCIEHEDGALQSMGDAERQKAVRIAKAGIPSDLRGAVWYRLSGGHKLDLAAGGRLYAKAIEDRFGLVPPAFVANPPMFGSKCCLKELGLTEGARLSLSRILACLAQAQPDRLFCPWLPWVVVACLQYMEEAEAYATATGLMLQDGLMLNSRQESWLILGSFDGLVEKYLKKAHDTLAARRTAESQPIAGFMTQWLFSALPDSALHNMLDNFFVKGQKILYRFAMAVVQRWYAAFCIAPEVAKPMDITPAMVAEYAVDSDCLAAEAFAFKFSHKDMERTLPKAHMLAFNMLSTYGSQSSGSPFGSNRSSIATSELAERQRLERIREVMPAAARSLIAGDAPWAAEPGEDAGEYAADGELRYSRSQRRAELTSHMKQLVSSIEYYSLEESLLDAGFGGLETPRSRLLFAEVMGKGAFGTVSRAKLLPAEARAPGEAGGTDAGSSSPDQIQDVAVKGLNEAAGVEEQARFLLEARMMTQLKHPNLVRLLAVCSLETPLLLVLELMSGGDLLTYLRACSPSQDEPLAHVSVRDMFSMATQVASAMHYLHGKSIVHRDLAARNVLLRDVGTHHVKLSDFGMSRHLEDGQYMKETDALVPIKWMSPESIHDRVYTTKSDCWSYGIFLWELTSFGDRPYSAYGPVETVQCVLSGFRLSQPPGCPVLLYELMLALWQAQAAARPTFDGVLTKLAEFDVGEFPDYINRQLVVNAALPRLDDEGYVLDQVVRVDLRL